MNLFKRFLYGIRKPTKEEEAANSAYCKKRDSLTPEQLADLMSHHWFIDSAWDYLHFAGSRTAPEAVLAHLYWTKDYIAVKEGDCPALAQQWVNLVEDTLLLNSTKEITMQ